MRKPPIFLIVLIVFFLPACLPNLAAPSITAAGTNAPELAGPAQTMPGPLSEMPPQRESQADFPTEELVENILWQVAGLPDQYWVTNPSSTSRIFTQVVHPQNWDGSALPALVLIPGGTGWGGNFLGPRKEAETLAERGFTVIVFDPDGRGRSEGEENWNGHIHQDGLMAVVEFSRQLPEVQAENVALISFSYGVTMASGYLARYPDNGIIFYIDWEGPVTRNDTTTSPQGECVVEASKNEWQPCDDDEWWSEREALTFMAQARVQAYQRVQSEKDHVQPDVTHAVQIINQAITSGIGWVRLNEYPANRTYDEAAPPDMLAENLDKIKSKIIADYAEELLMLFGN